MGTPLKLNGTDGDVKYFDTTEENYLAYNMGYKFVSKYLSRYWLSRR